VAPPFALQSQVRLVSPVWLQIIIAVLSYDRETSIVRFLCQNSRYKDGTTKACAFGFLAVPYRALQSDRCLVITTWSSLTSPFHGVNTGSNPVGDAKSNQWVAGISSETGHAVMAELVALRAILLDVMFKLANGQTLTAAEIQRLIDRADSDKLRKARERLLRAQGSDGQRREKSWSFFVVSVP